MDLDPVDGCGESSLRIFTGTWISSNSEATVIPPKRRSQQNVVGTDESLPLGPLLTRMDVFQVLDGSKCGIV